MPRPWLASYPPGVPEGYDYPDVPLTRLLDDAAKDFPDAAAIAFLGTTTTYRRLLDETDRLANALAGLGVGVGDRVGLALPNCPQHVSALFAVLRLGAVAVECGTDRSAEQLAAVVNTAGCGVLLIADPVYRVLGQLKGRLPSVRHVVATALLDPLPAVRRRARALRTRGDGDAAYRIPEGEGVLRYHDLVRRFRPLRAQVAVDPRSHLAALLPSAAGLVAYTHRNLLAAAFQLRLWIPDVQAGREEVVCSLPFASAAGLTAGLGFGVLSAATLAVVPEHDPDAALAGLGRRAPSLFPGDSATFHAAARRGKSAPLGSVRAALSVDGPVDEGVVADFEQVAGGRLRTGYAVGDLTPLACANPVYGRAKAASVGLPLCDTVVSLRHPADPGRAAPPGAVGHLAVAGPQVPSAYWRRRSDDAGALRDGWVLTGDLAEIDDEGYVRVVGRIAPSGAAP